jgi:hypothetical protein
MAMKKTLTVLFIFSVFISKADYWTQKADYPGLGRRWALGFSIENFGYMGFGQGDTSWGAADLWKYDSDQNLWIAVGNLPSFGTAGGVVFTIKNIAYIALGETADLTGVHYNPITWKYDPTTNAFTQMAAFPDSLRSFCTGLTINNKGYIFGGKCFSFDTTNTTTYFNQVWEFDPDQNVWSQKNDSPFQYNILIGFSLNNKGYIGGDNKFWEYSPTNDSWNQKNNFHYLYGCPNLLIRGQLFIGAGGENKYFWQYLPEQDTFIAKADFAGHVRNWPMGFSIGNKGYLGIGDHPTAGWLKDFWEYTPDSINDINNENMTFSMESYFDENGFFVCNFPPASSSKINLHLYDLRGRVVLSKEFQPSINNTSIKINSKSLSKGIYFVEANNRKDKIVRKFLKE